jgi:YesN/AraC family two-component response regulator
MNPIAILCIDDDRIMLQALVHQISTFLHEDVIIEVAESGKEGLEVINELIDDKYTIPVVISDQMMPGMTGIEFAKAVKIDYPQLKMILLSGYSKESMETIESQENIIATLQKPWEKIELMNLLARFYPMK